MAKQNPEKEPSNFDEPIVIEQGGNVLTIDHPTAVLNLANAAAKQGCNSFRNLDSSDISEEIASALAEINIINEPSGNFLYGFGAEFLLNRQAAHYDNLASNIRNGVIRQGNDNDRILMSKGYPIGCAFSFYDSFSGMYAHFYFDPISNTAKLTAEPNDSLTPIQAYASFGAIFLGVLDYCASQSGSTPKNNTPKKIIDFSGNVMDVDRYLPTSDDIEQIIDESLVVDQESKFSKIVGVDSAVKQLQDVALSFLRPDIMEKWGVHRPRAIILYGLPGTGKTTLINTLADEIDAQIVTVQADDIFDMWLGNSEKNIKGIFNNAHEASEPTVLFFDEIDTILGEKTSSSSLKRVVGIFKQELVNVLDNPNLIIAATANSLDDIDPAILRAGRFDIKIYIPQPTDQAIAKIFTLKIVELIDSETLDFAMFALDIDVKELGELCSGMTGADVEEILRATRFKLAMNEARTGVSETISQSHIKKAIEEHKRTL